MKRFVFAAIFAVCFVFLYSCGDDDEDSSITRLQSHLDGRLDNIEGEIDTLREDVNTLAAETKTPLTDGAIPPDPRRDLDAIREETGGLLPANAPVIGGGQIVFVVRHDDHNTLSIMNPNGTDVRVMVELHASIYHPALAPDGIGVAYTEGVFAGQRRIFVHRIDSPGRFLISGRDGLYSAWSHDGRWIAWGTV